jgi:hypothetical protein
MSVPQFWAMQNYSLWDVEAMTKPLDDAKESLVQRKKQLQGLFQRFCGTMSRLILSICGGRTNDGAQNLRHS